MKKYLHQALALAGTVLLSATSLHLKAQILEWRLMNPVYSSADPDGTTNPATGSVSFTLQIHTQSGSVPITGLSTGWAYQSAKTMIPTGVAGPGCPTANYPSGSGVANVSMSAAFTAAGYTYQTVNQCGALPVPIATGGQSFDKRSAGTITGGQSAITLTTAWTDVFTVTLWTLGSTAPQGGYAIINSGDGGTPAPFGTYSVSDVDANQFSVNSLTYTTPLAIGSGTVPITLSKFNATCSGSGALLSWETLTEINNDHFEIEKSPNGTTGWKVVSAVKGAGNSTTAKQYQFTDAAGSGPSYYRLRQVDIDGKFTYSQVEKTDCDNKAAQLVVYPVPASDVLNVLMSAERNSTATIKLLDAAGRVYKLQQTDVLKGSNKITLNVANLIAGQYILRIEKDNEVQTKVVMIK